MPPKLLPRNPYIASKALGDERGFFRREDIFRLVETALSSPGQNALVLFGQCRIGQTSILSQLRRHLPSPPFHPVYVDLMDQARKPLSTVLYELAATVAVEFNLPPPYQRISVLDDESVRRLICLAVREGSLHFTEPATDENAVITEDELMNILQRHGIRILIRELELAPKTLLDWEMLRRINGGYGFFIELMRRWVAERQPLPKVKDELDRVNPIADQHYQLANTYFRLGNLKEAIASLCEQGALDEAVKQLEEAYC